MNDLPLLNSERYQFQQKLKAADTKAQEAHSAALRFVNRIVNEADFLTEQQKELLLALIWK